jgi:hypothetical protein
MLGCLTSDVRGHSTRPGAEDRKRRMRTAEAGDNVEREKDASLKLRGGYVGLNELERQHA